MENYFNLQPIYLNNLLDKLFMKPFDDALEEFTSTKTTDKFFPYAHNIYYNEDNGLLTFEVSATGADKKDIEVGASDGILKIVVDKKKEDDVNKHYICRKLSEKSIHLEYKLSEKYDIEKISVTLDKGVLLVNVPVREESKPKNYTFE